MKEILVLSYAISPYRGSEFSVAWNYIVNMSKSNKLTVLYGCSDDHMGDNQTMVDYLSEIEINNVNFKYIEPPKISNLLNTLNKKNIFNYSFYFAYFYWHKEVFKQVKSNNKIENIDIIHFLNPIGFREPGFLWKINKPYIWGPIGGVNNIPLAMLKFVSFKGKIKFLFRALINNFQIKYSSRLKESLNNTDLLMTATKQTQRLINSLHNKQSYYIPENGITGNISVNKNKFLISGKINIIWIGKIEDRKALIILLKSLCEIEDKSNLVVNIVGDGPLKTELVRFASDNGLNHILKWHGSVSRENVFELINNAHLHIITSVSEGNPTTIWECMAKGVPTMTIDHCGMSDTICNLCGVKISLESDLVFEFSMQIKKIIKNPKILETYSSGVIECAKKFKWEERIHFMNNIYDKAIMNWKTKQKK